MQRKRAARPHVGPRRVPARGAARACVDALGGQDQVERCGAPLQQKSLCFGRVLFRPSSRARHATSVPQRSKVLGHDHHSLLLVTLSAVGSPDAPAA